MKQDPNTAIALYAFWNLRRAKSVKQLVPFHPQRFTGFLEAKLGLHAPAEWSMHLTFHPSVYRKEYFPAALSRYGPLGLLETWETGDGRSLPSLNTEIFQSSLLERCQLQTPVGTEFTSKQFTVDGKTFTLHSSVKNAIKKAMSTSNRYTKCRALAYGSEVFITLWGNDGWQCPLFCIDTRTTRLKWRSEIWASHGRYNSEPDPFSAPIEVNVHLVVGRGVLAVFGTGPAHCYVEVFNMRDGSNVLRFNPNICR